MGNSSCFAYCYWNFGELIPTPLKSLLCGCKGSRKRLQHSNWQASDRTLYSLPLTTKFAFSNTEAEGQKVYSDQNLELVNQGKKMEKAQAHSDPLPNVSSQLSEFLVS